MGVAGCGRVAEHADPALHGTACYACHGDLYLASTDPDHVAAGFAKACESCHQTTAWQPAEVGDHGFWPLTGAHQLATCEGCHAGGSFAGTPTACVGCHQADFAATTNPDHEARQLATTCEGCHTTEAWKPATFDHDALWPLVGAHAAAACESCHEGGTYSGTPSACVGCHLQDWQVSSEPNHPLLGIGTACESCHTAAGWRPAEFVIHDRHWPLADKHEAVACSACHVDGAFSGTARTCEGCHLDDYRATVDPDHEALALPTACGGCHTAAGWRPAGFASHDQFWPLEGRHESATCESCHEGGVFAGTPRACEGCHMAEYEASTDPDHRALALETACGGCHTARGWRPADFTAHDQFWPILGEHVGVACESCHAGATFADTPSACEGCHLEAYRTATRPDHVALELSEACGGCHTEEGWQPAGFEAHDQYWPIEGKHDEASCESCHEGSVFAGTARECEGCHLADYEESTEPPHAAAGFPKDCKTCHDDRGWSPATFDHESVWPLDGKHATTGCETCHEGGIYEGTARACEGCHLPDYEGTVDPNHAALGLPKECGACHTADGWSPANITVHDRFFPLTGAHATERCESCHVGGVFAGTPRQCAGCHEDDYRTTTDPAHAAAGYPMTCETCHGVAAWTPASFRHDTWPLTGRHTTVTCEDCHAGGVYAGTARDCDGCHRDDFQATTDPAHAADGYPTRCESCHRTTGWTPSSFQHGTYWPLDGQHASTTCNACHVDGVFDGTSKVCKDCHLTEYQATTLPPHAANAITTSCEQCHTAAAWTPAKLDHTRFWPLDGAHRTATCEGCHAGGQYDGTPRTCEGCHLADYQQATRPAHASAGYPRTCQTCHTTTAWSPSPFDHGRYWPLTGAHLGTTCITCHENQVFAGTARTCEGCHLDDYQRTTDPAHGQAGFSTTCEGCHATAAWTPSTFDHDSFWPLSGQHSAATCDACHAGGIYQGTARSCDGCHLPEYQATTRPDHEAAGYPTRCEACHAPVGWVPATFDHNQFWPLSGVHASASCESCHVGGVYAGTPRACSGCHLPEYQATTDPPHGAAGFSTSCESCHRATGWVPSTFNHGQYWPLTGQHTSASCASCHLGDVYEGTPRTCDGCHLPEYQATSDPAHAAAGFPTSCESCHVTTAWTPATFDHDVFWPLAGQHSVAACESCHVGGVYAGTPRACEGCHMPEYNATTAPDHAASGFPTTCEACHGPSGWTPATFDHDQFWPLTGQHQGAACESCHAGGVYAGTPTTCYACHQSDYSGASNPSHTALNLSTTCQTCHTTASWDTTTFPGHSTIFPISAGSPHEGFGCQDCHKTEAWSVFTCTGCHTGEHTLVRMNSKHIEVTNYQATLNTYGVDGGCLHCHPDGRNND